SLGSKFALLRSDSPLWHAGAKEEISRTVRARRKNRLLRAHGAASRLERRRAPDEGGPQRRSLRNQRHEGLDHEWRRGRCRDRIREHAARKRREGNHG